MSRSYRKHSWVGTTTADSEKEDKRRVNRILRRVVKKRLQEDEEALLPDIDEVMNVYNFGKDGKRWVDIEEEARLMRK